MQSKFYVYTLLDPITGIIRYVGCTVNPRVRYLAHINDALALKDRLNNGKKSEKAEWIRGLISLDQKPVMQLVDDFNTADEAAQEEQRLFSVHINTVFNCKKTSKYGDKTGKQSKRGAYVITATQTERRYAVVEPTIVK